MDGLDHPHSAVLWRYCPDSGGHDHLGTAFAKHPAARFAADQHHPCDRLFIGLLGSAYLHLLVIGVTDWSIWVASALSLVWLLSVMRWG